MRKSDKYVEENGMEPQLCIMNYETEVCWCYYDRSVVGLVVGGSSPEAARYMSLREGTPAHLMHVLRSICNIFFLFPGSFFFTGSYIILKSVVGIQPV